MAIKHYKNISDLKEIDDVFKIADKVLSTKHIAITNPSAAPKIVAASLTAVAGTGAAIAGAGAIGAGVTGAGAISGLAAGAGGTLAATAGGIALAPVAIPLALVGGIGYLIFKNKKAKELNAALQSRLKKAVEKQNQIIRKYNELIKEQKEAMEKKVADYEEIIKQQAQKIDELLAMLKSLELIINKMSEQLAA